MTDPTHHVGRSRHRSGWDRLRWFTLLIGWIVIAALGLDVGRRGLDIIDDPRPARGQVATRADIPTTMQDLPWARAYIDELTSIRFVYQPYIVETPEDLPGPLVTIRRGVRVTRRPSGRGLGRPVDVWFFGGSTMFGAGQRDQHTIPSEFVRIADHEGIDVRAVNFGRLGFVSWQEVLLFEAELTRRPPPDLVVFYDGSNDYFYQRSSPTGEPVLDPSAGIDERIARNALPLPADLLAHPQGPHVGVEIADALTRQRTAVMQAAESTPTRVDQASRSTRRVYLRAVQLARALAFRANAQPRFFWQPVDRGPSSAYRRLAAGLPSVIDLTALFDDAQLPIFVDDTHTLEAGAALVAQAMYDDLETTLDREARS